MQIKENIKKWIDAEPEHIEHYAALFDVCRTQRDYDENRKLWYALDKKFLELVRKGDYYTADEFDKLCYKCVLWAAPERFEEYLMAIDYRKAPAKRFYYPRRHYLKPIVDKYQVLADGKIRFLSVSMPKRSGKSQLGINFICWRMGQYPDKAILAEGTGDALVNSFYKGILEYLDPQSDYSYYDIFPERSIANTDAKLKVLNLDQPSRFPTFMARSIDATQVGLSEASNVLYLDDCVDGHDEAKNRERLEEKWTKLSGDVMGRALEGVPMVICGTRYSLYDPIGKLQAFATENGWKWECVEIPALDPVTDESNYEYIKDGVAIFTTQYFREQRALLTDAQWASEFQQQPIEAKGTLFNKADLHYYSSLPDAEPDAIIACCDTADVGSDYTSMPVAYIYGDDVFIHDVVFDQSPPTFTQPMVAKCLMKNKVSNAKFESNNSGRYYADAVRKILEDNDWRFTEIETKRTVTNKETRIEMSSGNIIKRFHFRDPGTYDVRSQYAQFMRNLTSYSRTSKNLHDDAPDSLAMLETSIRTMIQSKIEVFKRPI